MGCMTYRLISSSTRFKSASTIIRTSSGNDTVGFHFKTARAFVASPRRVLTSAGR